MEFKEELYALLFSKQLKLVASSTPSADGSYADTFAGKNIMVRYVSIKGDEFVCVGCAADKKPAWYDIALLRALLLTDNDFRKPMLVEEQCDFLISAFVGINELFSKRNAPGAKMDLEALKALRLEQLSGFIGG